jgi:hypothetical protein
VTTTAADDHSDGLAEFGYKQELDRSLGKFASFAVGVSCISILTGLAGPAEPAPAEATP